MATPVAAVTLDQALPPNRTIDLLITDAEGFDYVIARGASHLFAEGRIRLYIFEMHGPDFDGHVTWLWGLNYQCFFIMTGGPAGRARQFSCANGKCKGNMEGVKTRGWLNSICVHRQEEMLLTWMLQHAVPVD